MTLEESWNLYSFSEVQLSDPRAQGVNVGAWFFMPRGGVYLILLLVSSIGATPFFVNSASIAFQLTNLALFTYIIWRIAGSARLLPVFLAALLYPFASGGHFWQISLIHHVAVFFFLSAFVLFLCVGWSRDVSWRDVVFFGLPGLVCFWLSLNIMEHAILMPLLFAYLALYRSSGRSTLWRFCKPWSPGMGLSLAYLGVSAVFIGMTLFQIHRRPSFLLQSGSVQFDTVGSFIQLPALVIKVAVVSVNALLFFAGAVLANSIGYVGYPLLSVVENVSLLLGEVSWWGVSACMVALLGAYLLCKAPQLWSPGDSTIQPGSWGFVIVLGLIWALLAYLPVSMSFAYPRVIGQITDRVNAIALFGVSLSLGGFVAQAIQSGKRSGLIGSMATFAVTFMGITVLLVNLYLQREYWVEGYRKELGIVMDVLERLGRDPVNGRRPLVLLDRTEKPEPPRLRLRRGLQEKNPTARLFSVAKVVLSRYFTEAGETEVTSFHLKGIPLFGGGPVGGWVFNNYAKRLGKEPVVVYRIEPGVIVQEADDSVRLVGYRAWPEIRYSLREFEPTVLKLDESFFKFRGAATYAVQPMVSVSSTQ
jgi:hypothetical protein